MSKRNNPSTSNDAYKSLQPDQVRAMYVKIVEALKIIGPSTYEELAKHMKEKPERIWKRLSEAGSLNLIHRPGERRVMASGRQGFVWAVGPPTETSKKRERVMKGKTIVQFSKDILNPERLF